MAAGKTAAPQQGTTAGVAGDDASIKDHHTTAGGCRVPEAFGVCCPVPGRLHLVDGLEVARTMRVRVRVPARKRAVIYFGWVFFLISSGSPHVRPMGRTCGEPDEIGLTPHGGEIERLTTYACGCGCPPACAAAAAGEMAFGTEGTWRKYE